MNKKALGKAPAPASKKVELKTPVKMSKVISPKLASNHNETLILA